MVFGLEKYLTRTFKQEDLQKAQDELQAAADTLGAFNLKSNETDMEEVMKSRDAWKEKFKRVEEIEAALNAQKAAK